MVYSYMSREEHGIYANIILRRFDLTVLLQSFYSYLSLLVKI